MIHAVWILSGKHWVGERLCWRCLFSSFHSEVLQKRASEPIADFNDLLYKDERTAGSSKNLRARVRKQHEAGLLSRVSSRLLSFPFRRSLTCVFGRLWLGFPSRFRRLFYSTFVPSRWESTSWKKLAKLTLYLLPEEKINSLKELINI